MSEEQQKGTIITTTTSIEKNIIIMFKIYVYLICIS